MLPNLLNLSNLHDGMMYCPMSIISKAMCGCSWTVPILQLSTIRKPTDIAWKEKNCICFRIFVSISLMPICIAVTWRTLLRITGAPSFSAILWTCPSTRNFLFTTDWGRLTWNCVISIYPIITMNWPDSFSMKWMWASNGLISTIAATIIITGKTIRRLWNICARHSYLLIRRWYLNRILSK